MQTITCSTHGEAQGNPGPAAIGVVITDAAGTVLHELGQSIGNSSAAYAAYHAVLVGLQSLLDMYGEETTQLQFELRISNPDVAAELAHTRPVTHPGLVPLFMAIHNLRVEHFPQLTVTVVTNAAASELRAKALD